MYEDIKEVVKTLFKNDYGQPFELTDGQAEIFNLIFRKQHNRVHVMTCTQYGKSDTISMAVLLRVRVFNEKFAIVAGSKDKAEIIMQRIIQHCFDNDYFKTALELDPDSLDRLRRERSKERIDFAGGGSVRIFTANTSSNSRVRESLTGFGSPNVIEEEASIIPDESHAMVMRMLGGHKDNFLLKIGNPFYPNHFKRSYENPKYKKVDINYKQAIAEGRYTEDFIEEMREQPFFSILYENKFPDESEYLPDGYRRLIAPELIDNSFVNDVKFNNSDVILGGDFAGGGNDRTVYVVRKGNQAKIESTNKIADTMQQVPIIEEIMQKYNIDEQNVFLDQGGLGQGVIDRLHEKDVMVNGIMFGASAFENDKYKNVRAEMYYHLKNWLKNGGKLERNEGFRELLSVNFKVDSEKKFSIQPKIDLKKYMKKLGIQANSPDIADALALTFVQGYNSFDEDDILVV